MEQDLREATLLRELEERLLQSATRKSAAAVAALLADDFIEFGSSGGVFDKAEIVGALQDEEPMLRSLSDFAARRRAPGVVLVTYRATRRGTADKSTHHSLRCSIWKPTDGRWQMVFHQGTRTPPRR